jgi:hypothetical protein
MLIQRDASVKGLGAHRSTRSAGRCADLLPVEGG